MTLLDFCYYEVIRRHNLAKFYHTGDASRPPGSVLILSKPVESLKGFGPVCVAHPCARVHEHHPG